MSGQARVQRGKAPDLQSVLALHLAGQVQEAEQGYRTLIAAGLKHHAAYANLAAICVSSGRHDEAIALLQSAIQIKPDLAEARWNLGRALGFQGKFHEAAACLQQVLELKPDLAEVHYDLGVALHGLGRLDDAVESYRKALQLKPDYPEPLNNLGAVLRSQGKLDDAVACFRRVLELRPDSSEAYTNLGNAFRDLGRLEEAIGCHRRALQIRSDYPEALANLGGALRDQGKIEEAAACYQRALQLKPDREEYSNLLFFHAYDGSLGPQTYLALARGWEQQCVPQAERQAARGRRFKCSPLPGRRLRVGYVSGDYRQHAVSFFVERLFAQHDRTRVQVFAYSTSAIRDAVTERIQRTVEHWVPLMGIPDAAARDRIEADGIDVLIDLSGHTAHNRLGIFARRAAPVQAHYVGYFASTGLTEMDYWIGDEMLTPAHTDAHFQEKLWRLPRVWMSYDGKADAPAPDWCPGTDGTLWLGSFNSLGKLTPQTLTLWARVLHALPQARLLLKTKELADAANRRRMLDVMAGQGIAPERIELRDRSVTPDWAAHMAYYNRLDIALDPVGGMGGATTTCDALWMAVPVITLAGERMAERTSASMLHAIAHPEWIAHSEEQYIDKVVTLATDMEQRKRLRPLQRQQMAQSPLCDGTGLARCLEQAYTDMFERRLQTQPGG